MTIAGEAIRGAIILICVGLVWTSLKIVFEKESLAAPPESTVTTDISATSFKRD